MTAWRRLRTCTSRSLVRLIGCQEMQNTINENADRLASLVSG
jgi:hypothetical protein